MTTAGLARPTGALSFSWRVSSRKSHDVRCGLTTQAQRRAGPATPNHQNLMKKQETKPPVHCSAWLAHWFSKLSPCRFGQSFLQVFRSLKIEHVLSGNNRDLGLLLWCKNLLHCVGVNLENLRASIAIHCGDEFRVVWTRNRIWFGGIELQWPNDPSSATRPTKAFACNLDAMAGFAAAHG